MILDEQHLNTLKQRALAYNQFDFEQQIMKCWGVVTDIDDVYKALYEEERIDNDTFANAMLGMKTIYEFRFNELFAMFEQSIAEKGMLRRKVEELQNELNKKVFSQA